MTQHQLENTEINPNREKVIENALNYITLNDVNHVYNLDKKGCWRRLSHGKPNTLPYNSHDMNVNNG